MDRLQRCTNQKNMGLLDFIPIVGPVLDTILGFGNQAAQENANESSQNFQREMYKQQRQDSIDDWNRQNTYNSPQATMERLKVGGLNPNLVYGNGATTQAGPVRSSSPGSFKAEPAGLHIDPLGKYLQVQNVQQNIDNLKAQNNNIQADTMLKVAQKNNVDIQSMFTQANAEKLGVDINTGKFNLEKSQGMYPGELKLQQGSLTMQEAATEKTRAETERTRTENQVAQDRNAREALVTSQNLQLGMINMLQKKLDLVTTREQQDQIEQAINNARKDEQLKNYEINLNKKGIQKSDDLLMRAASSWLDKLGLSWILNGPKIGDNEYRKKH
ncbi:DNA pilot protein [Blackfly microvirus SF02]|uniref:DNA pilot protein n=1 Tax=Blackfly microvirus SF02 TaxID=2576452 RepID=A0A4P8PRU3_9VIRU|nr:DNA pilot protein [Blackfly microvirus SF02]